MALKQMWTSYAEGSVELTPSDTVRIPAQTQGILIGVAGDLAVEWKNGAQDILPVPAGYNMIAPKYVLATGTTATGIHALF